MYSYVARQPIVDKHNNLYAYELLFRDTENNTFPKIHPDTATTTLIAENELTMGLQKVTDNKLAFINFPTDTLINNFPDFIDPSTVVIEILEDVEVSDKLVSALETLSKKGYVFALDDFNFDEKWLPIVPFAQIVKVDIQLVSLLQCMKQIRREEYKHVIWLAEKVETEKQFAQYLSLGFTYFQGYYFSPPEMIKKNKVSLSQNLVVELISLVSEPKLNYNTLEQLFLKDITLTYKLLRFLNNANKQLEKEIESVRHALIYLGEHEVKKYLSLLLIANLASEKNSDLVLKSLQRAKFCEIVLTNATDNKFDDKAFLAGMLSQIDLILGYPLDDVLQLIPLHPEIKAALVKIECRRSIALQIAKAKEQNNEELVVKYAEQLDAPMEKVDAAYAFALDWSKTII
ncbi:HDOD domain-containing protein [Psychrosphaera sp. B3R10]|uniref:EAL and HDOD domain-containing protein n=1 Tax=unclassified Psychrosphaera TaxID=2641570 RepID=UPI001C087EDB|nr:MULTISPECIES: HDOD domain-containing protein [unclassified Psychrosphaera]MBU2880618.1 HDOD domain-containing protein [Psychrosphaera sp. I2R16]MBU2990704.1 HDOD domain-containing protein [Psychrosphaera sp. B3R10]